MTAPDPERRSLLTTAARGIAAASLLSRGARCGRRSEPYTALRVSQPPAVTRDRVTLSGAITLDPAWLRVAYTLVNGTGEDIAVFNRIAVGPDENVPEGLLHAYTAYGGGALQVRAMRLPLPMYVNLTAEILPFVSRVAPGERLHDVVHVPLPATVNDPYRPLDLGAPHAADRGAQVTATAPREADRVALDVGFVRVRDRSKIEQAEGQPAGVGNVTDMRYGQVVLGQQFQLSGPIRVFDYQVVRGRG